MIATLAARQLDALPAMEGTETKASVDVVASLARAARHDTALAHAAPSADPRNRAGYAALVADFFDALGLANVSGAEIVAVHSRVTPTGVKNRLPGPWGVLRLAVVAIYSQHVRDRAGVPLRFTSLFRHALYNAAIGGATRGARLSQHVVCTASDRVLVGRSARDLWEIDRALDGARLPFTAEQIRAISAFRRATGYRGKILSSAVGRAPFDPGPLNVSASGFNVVGGGGLYRGFVHWDLRGIPARWTA